MRTIRLGRTNADVSVVSFGAWPIGGPNTNNERSVGWTGHDDDLAKAALRAALDAGINHWDTADVYGDGRSERLIGEVFADGSVPRDEVFLATKTGWDKAGRDHWYAPDQITERLERSLKFLKTEVIDLYYLHHSNFGDDDEYLDDAVATLRAAKDAGKIRFIGLSDWFSDKVLKYAARVDPDVVQVYRNVAADTWGPTGLQAYCAEHDVGAAFFSPLRHGLLLGKYDAPVTWPDGDFRQNVDLFQDVEALTTLRDHVARLETRFTHLPQPVLNALLGPLCADTPTGCTLVGLRNPDQVAAAAAADQALTADEAAWVRALYRDVKV